MTERPSGLGRNPTAPPVMGNGHFATIGADVDAASYEHGVQVIDENKEFNPNLSKYLSIENVTPAGFNYHLISVFGSQSTGKSTLLNHLFGTQFSVMSELERRQTTKGIWMSNNKKQGEGGTDKESRMADNILVMDVEGTDGRERGEDQDFERKSALFALATSEVLIVNIWEHQVGLYQGANMGLLKTVFEVNLQLFLKDRSTTHRSLLFFVIRDFIGTTPLKNLQKTLMEDLNRLWATISKPAGLENATIHDYFDFQFFGLPHKGYQPDQFVVEAKKLGLRFREGYRDPKRDALKGEFSEDGVFLPEYHRRIPADGFSHYAEGIWDQIVNNKDLDLPTQQELLAQFRCDEILREVMIGFDEAIIAFEDKQAEAVRLGAPEILGGLGVAMRGARTKTLKGFEVEASRYHKGVYQRKKAELEGKVDTRLKALFHGQLSAAHKSGIRDFSDAVTDAVKSGQKKGGNYDFAEIVNAEAKLAMEKFEEVARSTLVEGTSWSNYKQEVSLYQKELAEVSARLRRDEMRRLASRVERWVQSRLSESVGLEFNSLGSGRAGGGAPENGEKPSEKVFWDRVWSVFVETVLDAERRFTDRASSFDASLEEVDVGLWRLRRKSWGVLRAKIDEEMTEGNLLLKLRENFEDKFRYDDEGVPRIWRPTDDIEGVYTRARESTLTLIPLLSRFRLVETAAPPPLDRWVGHTPSSATSADEEDLAPIGGVDEDEGKSLEEEMTILGDSKRQELTVRFKKAADGVYVEAKRSAIGGMTQVPLYFYGLLIALGWNEIVAVLRNPAYFFLLFVCGIGAYITFQLNLWGPILKMTEAASHQALEEGKRRLRDFLEASDTGRQAIAMSERAGSTGKEEHEMSDMQKRGGSKANDDLDDLTSLLITRNVADPALPATFDDLPDKRRYWPAPAGSEEEGLGMLRLLTPDVVAQAAQTQIKTGERVCLNWDIENLNPPGFGRRPFEHCIKWVAEGVAFDDEYHFNPQQSSQWDGLRHHNAPAPTPDDPARRMFYGGTTAHEIKDTDSPRIGIGFWAKKGIAGRGVLIDYVSYAERKGISIDALTRQMISLDEVHEIARDCGITFQRGDIFFLRVGLPRTWAGMSAAQRTAYSQQAMPQHAGIEQSERVLRFIWDEHFAAVASDAVSFEVFPPLSPEHDLHHHLLAGWGLPIGEMFDLDELAATCQRLGRWSFFVSSSPLNCARGVSSPPNCMAIF